MASVISQDANVKRETFFRILFGEHRGYLCIARRQQGTRTMEEEFFQFPDELGNVNEHVEAYATTYDMYYCPHLLEERRRKKEYVSVTPCLWSDLDACHPDQLFVPPTIVVESSPRRYQALWMLGEEVDPSTAEDYSRRIAYAHANQGADKSGWDLTQLLRIPFTPNHKYNQVGVPKPIVRVISTGRSSYLLKDFDEHYHEVVGFEYTQIPFPDTLPLEPPESILQKYRTHLKQAFWNLYNETPTEDWSKSLWQVELFLAEAGMSREEMFVVANDAACNKYKRDERPSLYLWKEVCKAFAKVDERSRFLPTGEFRREYPDLLAAADRSYCLNNPTVVERYVEWAKTVGDAAWQYHQAGAFILLSSLLAGRVKLPTSYGTVIPNVWFLILADTTLTRKTTAMDLATDILVELDSDAVLATDGSIEGLMTSLSFRPGRPSLFLRDEFSGLLDALIKKDYYAGMSETLTKLYDGKYQKRVLRKETLEVREPVLIFFAGGIRTRVLELLTGEQVVSGFIPRFVVVAAESDVSMLRPLGPPTTDSTNGRAAVLGELRSIRDYYVTAGLIEVDGRTVSLPKRWEASMSPDAWAKYNHYEAVMLQCGMDSEHPDLATPTFDRLSKSGLKLAVLLSASRQREESLLVEEEDIVRAFFYIEQWRPHTIELLNNVGTTATERGMQKVLKAIRKNPGVTRSQLMQAYHLTAHAADAIFNTLEQRGLINRVKDGRTERLTPA